MNRFLITTTLLGSSLVSAAAIALPNQADVYPAQGGPIRITPIYHASLQIEYRGKVIQVDPFSAGDYSGAKKADLILITHTHADHLDLKAIKSVRKAGTILHAPLAARKQLSQSKTNNVFLIAQENARDSFTFLFKPDISVIPVRAYNLVRGPKPGQRYHPKNQFNGYILLIGGKRIYIAGDTEATPEMKALKNIDIAFLPMNLPFTMTPQEAAAGARAFKPKVVYPYHYRYPFDKPNDNPQQFAKALAGSGIQVKLRGWYAHPAAK